MSITEAQRIPQEKEAVTSSDRFVTSLSIITFMLCLGQAVTPLFAAEPVEVIVEGVEGDMLKNVEAALAIPPGLIEDGEVNVQWLDRFARQAKEKVVAAVEPFGYYDSEVDISLESVDERHFRLMVRVNPGEPVRVTEARIEVSGPGREEKTLKDLASAFPLQKGDILRHDPYEEAKGALKSEALALGYLDADFPVHTIFITKAENAARIELVLETGQKYLFGEVSLVGTPEYPQQFLMRYLAFKPGEVFSYPKLAKTQLNYMNSDRFEEVHIIPEKERAEEMRLPVTVRLKPSPSKRLRFGIGYGTDTGPRLSIDYRNLNMFSRGHVLHADLNLSGRLQGIGAGYILPSLRDINSFTEIQMKLQRENVSEHESRLLSMEVNRTRAFGSGRLGVAYLKAQREHFTAGDETSDSFLILPGLRFSEHLYDSLVRPTRGHKYEIEVRGTHQILGSDTGFLQILADGRLLLPLPGNLSLKSRLKAAATLQNETSAKDLPLSLRFFAGGDRSVRGYGYQSLGPKDESGEVVGGKNLLEGSVELERIILKNWGVAAFYDVGNAFNSLSSIRLFQGAGIGSIYYTRIGPVSLYIARQIGVDDPRFRLHFTVGFEL